MPMYTDRSTRDAVLGVMLAAGLVVGWSSGFIGATLGTRDAEPLTLLMWRFVVVAPLLLAVPARGPRPTRRDLLVVSAIGVLSQGVYLLGTVVAVGSGVAAGTVALIAALQPVLAAALAGPVLGERTGAAAWLGLAVGVTGVAVVVAGDLGAGGGPSPWAHALPVAAVAGLTAATLLERRLRPGVGAVRSLAVQCAGSAVVFSALALATGDAAPPADATFWLAVAWLVVLSTIGGYGLYWLVAARSGATRVSTLILLTPPATALWALVMFGQPVGAATVVGMLVSLGGVFLARPRAARRCGPSSAGTSARASRAARPCRRPAGA